MSRLEGIERGLAIFSWVAAGALVLMLFVGPVLVAEDEPSAAPAASKGAAGGSGAGGEELFADNCGGCHALSAAGTTGSVGPSLDDADLDTDEVASIVSEGRGTMPAFSGDLDDAEIDAIAQFVAESSGS